MKRFWSIIPILAIAVAVKWPIESSILKDRQHFKYGGARLTLSMREQMPQMMAIALLGGFRGVVADFVWIDANVAWEKQEWFKMKQYFNLVTSLQPMSVMYWETSSWHMAWNISYAVSQNPEEPRASRRELARREWIEEGARFLDRGLQNIPEKYDLYFHMGWLIMQKQDYLDLDPKTGYPGKHYIEAAEWFKRAWLKFPKDAPTYVSRMVGHCYMKADRWQEARDWWCFLWRQDHAARPDQLWDKVGQWGRECEDHLRLPSNQRCFPRA